MDYKRVVQTWLTNYYDMKLQAQSYKALYNEMEEESPCEVMGRPVDYSKDKLSPTNAFSSSVENTMVKRIEMRDKALHLENKILCIDEALKKLEPKEQAIISMRYMNKKKDKMSGRNRIHTWIEISLAVGYEESWCRRIENRAIDKMAMLMFGEKSTKNP